MSTPARPPTGPQARVRVTGPARRTAPARPSLDAEHGPGAVYAGSLLRVQLRLGLAVAGVLAATLGVLPLLFFLAPGLAGVHVLGLPLAWLLLAVLTYPYLLLLGWWFVRRAEANERDFAALVAEGER